jgi:hypothetical protein
VKVISKDAAIAAISIVPDELKPLGGYYLGGIIAAVTQRYQFAKSPTVQDAIAEGARFQQGRFIRGEKQIAITELGLYNDALAVTTTDTKDSQLVLSDLFGWLQETFKFREPITKPVPAFQSDLVVEFEHDPSDAFASFKPLVQFLQQQRENLGHQKKPIAFNRLAFGADALLPGPNADFLIERRVGVPWEMGRYFAKAHLQTDAHIEALELLEKLLAEKS